MTTLTLRLNGTPTPVRLGENVAVAALYAGAASDNADAAALSAATAESAAGPTYVSSTAGLAATVSGEAFAVDNGDGTVTVYLNSSGAAVAQRTLATTAALAAPGGAGMLNTTAPDFPAIIHTAHDWAEDWPDAMQAIPANLRAGIRAMTSEVDVSGYVQNVVDVMQETGKIIRFPRGRYWLETGIDIPETGQAPAIVGTDWSQRAMGSSYQPVTFIYAGTGDYLFRSERSYTNFANFSVRNVGSAKYMIDLAVGGHHRIENIGAISDPGNTLGEIRFELALIRAYRGALNYSRIVRLDTDAYAPVGILLQADGTGGGTRLHIEDCVWETSAWGNFTGLKTDNDLYEQIKFQGVTLNGYNGMAIGLVDTSTNPRTQTLQSLILDQCEIDFASAAPASLVLNLKNVPGAQVIGGSMTLGSCEHFAQLDNSHISAFSPGDLRSLTNTIFNRVNGGALETVRGVRTNGIDLSTTAGLKNSTDNVTVAPVAAGLTRIKINEGGDVPTFVITFIANTTTSLHLAAEDDSVRGLREDGREFDLEIRNSSGGALTGIGLAAPSIWRLAGGAMTFPANGNAMTYRFKWRGSYAREVCRIETAI